MKLLLNNISQNFGALLFLFPRLLIVTSMSLTGVYYFINIPYIGLYKLSETNRDDTYNSHFIESFNFFNFPFPFDYNLTILPMYTLQVIKFTRSILMISRVSGCHYPS